MPSLLTVTDLFPWITLGIALLIGVLVGAERETARTLSGVGLRDIVLTSAIGWISGRLHEPLLAIAMLAGVVTLMIVQRVRQQQDLGVTTEFAVIAVYALAYVLGSATDASLIALIVALAIALTLLLDAKASVKRLFQEVITGAEFADTVRFLAIIFIILPLLPEGRFGPYEFFSPRTLWVAVILVTGVSYVGYFFEKYLGVKYGTWAVAILGGIVSTTVMTQAFAKQVAQDSGRLRIAWQAATLANSIQFPRLMILLLVAAPSLAQLTFAALIPAFVASIVMSMLIGYGQKKDTPHVPALKNPLRLSPAIQFAFFMAALSFVSAAAFDLLGNQGLFLTSAIGAILDVDAIALTAADRVSTGVLDVRIGQHLLLIAIGSNMIVKTILAGVSGSRAFLIRMSASFLVMFMASALGILLFG